MRLVHLSDTHLGFSSYSKLDPETGVNQREADFYRAFERAIDRIVSIDPDVVVHAGDLFDSVRPQNRAIDTAMRQLIRLSEAGIPTVLISGNHSTPRLKETGNILGIFDHLEGIHPVYEPGVKDIVVGDLTVHAVPHSTSPPVAETVSAIRDSSATRFNVLVLHVGIAGSGVYRMDEFNEQLVSPDGIPSGMDYVALGHYHRFSEVGERMYYSGSTERHGFGEAGQKKGFVELDLEEGTVEFHELDVRDMVDMPPLDASELSASDILREVRGRIDAECVDDKIARLRITGVRPETGRSLDVPSMKRMASDALHFELKIERKGEEHRPGSDETAIGSLRNEFRRYVEGLDMADEKRRRLLELGEPYFAEGEE